MKKKDRGSTSSAALAEGITVLRWKNNNLVALCCSYAGYPPADVVERWSSSEKKKLGVERPFLVKEYNKCMGVVDLLDSLTSHYRNDFRK
ncbi:hypothetical protein QYM36_013282 [Artemia franciscana]|uniref:PiggyBac transposable element-derived protein domain-containing protein n=1 Tax=Artemia franciscana TaxID=6661 RepID=A0AA88L1V6_ARTSF|nr:hypothetical protein QYM36_013282 [Artemia franciscana]